MSFDDWLEQEIGRHYYWPHDNLLKLVRAYRQLVDVELFPTGKIVSVRPETSKLFDDINALTAALMGKGESA